MNEPKADMAPAAPAEEAGSINEATDALLTMLDAEDAPPTEPDKATPEEAEESQPETEDDSEEEEEVDTDSDDEDEYEPEAEPDVEGQDADVYSINVGGETIEVTLDELQAGYSRQSDYTRKTQELAGERNQLIEAMAQHQGEVQQNVALREQYVQAIGQFITQANSNLGEYSRIDWASLKENDPIEYMTKRDEFREHQGRIQHAQRLQQKAVYDSQAEQSQMVEHHVIGQHQLMGEIVPEWNDPEKRSALAGQIRGYGHSEGFSDEELDGLTDHRSLHVMLKAMKYDELNKGTVRDKKVRNKPRLVKSGSSRTKEASNKKRRATQINQLKESGSYKDAAKLLEDLL